MRKHFLDLFSGLGGASEAFTQDLDHWTVLRIDNNPLLANVPFTIIDDIKHLAKNLHPSQYSRSLEKIECIWASPPCTDFSGGFNSPKSIASRTIGLDNYQPDLTLMLTALEIIETIKPKYWVIENVVGSIPYFREHLGEPTQIIGPYVLWGSFPQLIVDKSLIKKKVNQKDVGPGNPLRSNYRAIVDFEISKALKDALETQTSIFDY